MSDRPDIETIPRDRAIALAKAISGFLPGVGDLFSQIILDDIPGQRLDRVVDYVRLLESRIADLEVGADELREKMAIPENVDLFEEGATLATRALTDMRREHIASIVSKGIAGEEAERIESKRLLGLLSAIDDDQIVVMTSYLHRNLRDQDFHELHKRVLEPAMVHMQSSRAEHDQALVHDLARADLVRLGLLKNRFKKPSKGEMPEFDENTGAMKTQGLELTPLGRLLLRRAGLAEDEEF